jgi:hypothetical protein
MPTSIWKTERMMATVRHFLPRGQHISLSSPMPKRTSTHHAAGMNHTVQSAWARLASAVSKSAPIGASAGPVVQSARPEAQSEPR